MRLLRKWKIHNRKSIETLMRRKVRHSPYRCPCCQTILYRHSYSEEYYGEIEGGYYCDVCKYKDYHAYGYQTVGIGCWEDHYDYKTSGNEALRIHAEHDRQIVRAKRERKRSRRFYYAKKKSQRKAA